MAKGRKTGGRKPGTPNKASLGVKDLLGRILSDEASERHWRKWLGHKDAKIAWEAFKLAQAYQHGKPPQPLGGIGEEDSPPIKIDISAIPRHREPVN